MPEPGETVPVSALNRRGVYFESGAGVRPGAHEFGRRTERDSVSLSLLTGFGSTKAASPASLLAIAVGWPVARVQFNRRRCLLRIGAVSGLGIAAEECVQPGPYGFPVSKLVLADLCRIELAVS